MPAAASVPATRDQIFLTVNAGDYRTSKGPQLFNFSKNKYLSISAVHPTKYITF
jgi:hypothetical protein